MRRFVTKIVFNLILLLTKSLKVIAPPDVLSWLGQGWQPVKKNDTHK